MRTKGKLSFTLLLVPVLLFVGMQVFAQTTANNGTPVTGPASHKAAAPDAGMLLISDRASLMKSIRGMAMKHSVQSAPGCSSSVLSAPGTKASHPVLCPIVDCAAPPPGCFYQGPADTDANGCAIDCGHLVCGSDSL